MKYVYQIQVRKTINMLKIKPYVKKKYVYRSVCKLRFGCIFKCISWLNDTFFGGERRSFLKDGVKT